MRSSYLRVKLRYAPPAVSLHHQPTSCRWRRVNLKYTEAMARGEGVQLKSLCKRGESIVARRCSGVICMWWWSNDVEYR